MTTGMPELGSKISLISKADIRYEGRLFTVDPQECTIALASVRSFGTEDRETQFPVPAQNQVYDYILFRGSDIKDIRVVNTVSHPQPLNDPAIMQLSVPPTLGPQQFQQHPILGHMGHNPYGSFLPMGGLTTAAPGLPAGIGRAGSAPGSKPSELIISSAGGGPDVGVAPPSILSPPPPVGEPPRPNEHPDSVLDFIGGAASRSTTPASVGSRKSLSVDQGTQAGGNQQRDGNKRQVKPIQPPRGQHHHQQQPQPRTRSRERRDYQNREGDREEQGTQQHQNQVRQQNNRGRPQNQHYQQGNHGGYQQNNQGGYQYRGGWGNQRGMPRGRGRPRGGPFRPGIQTGQQQGNKKTTLKFDSEYDFEQANTEFEELKNKLAKVKLDEASGSKPEVNGAVVESEKKDDSGNETGAGETEQEEEHEVFYDKTKSFFDKISCEAVERAKGKMQRTDWRQERKLNSETFGVAATRRGSYRGRGGFRGGYRGGYRGAYRYPQQRRNNDQQQNNQQNQQGNKDEKPVYCPLSNEEIQARKDEECEKLQVSEASDVEKEKDCLSNGEKPRDDDIILVLTEQATNSNDKSDLFDDGQKVLESEKIVVDNPPACVGQ